MFLYGYIGGVAMSFESIFHNPPDPAHRTSVNCVFCQKEKISNLCPNIPYIQEHLLNAANILSLVVETTPTKELCFASETISRDDIAIAALNLVCLVQKLEVLKEAYEGSEQELFD